MSADQIITDVCNEFGVTRAQLLGRSRVERFAWARHVAMWELRRQLGLTYVEIGRIVKHTHGSIHNGLEHVKKRGRDFRVPPPKTYGDYYGAKRQLPRSPLRHSTLKRASEALPFTLIFRKVFQPVRSFREVACIEGITPQRVQQIETSAFWKIWMRMRDPRFNPKHQITA